jgi:uncharacterized protein with HEPN domain
MSKRNPKLLIEDILESSNKILTYTNGMSFAASPMIAKPLMLSSEILKSLAKLQIGYRMTSRIYIHQ